MAEDLAGAMRNGLVDRAMQLHALLDDCRGQRVLVVVGKDVLPSKGFINASLVMVAAAPLAASTGQQSCFENSFAE